MGNSTQNSSKVNWQEQLKAYCSEYGFQPPLFQIVSDRRGGRTAWSSTVQVFEQQFEARFWYDGKNLDNARNDVAEVAYNWAWYGGSSMSPQVTYSSSSSGW